MENRLEQEPGIHERQPKQGIPVETSYLRLLTPKPLIIPACAGGPRASLIYAPTRIPRMFLWKDGRGFKHWKLDTEQPATEATPVLVYELHKDGRLVDIFSSFNVDKKALAFKSQEQIENFPLTPGSGLGDCGAYFLFTEKINGQEEFFVAEIFHGYYGILKLNVISFLNDFVFREFYKYRFVFPVNGFLIP
jgi:hypothetical protein